MEPKDIDACGKVPGVEDRRPGERPGAARVGGSRLGRGLPERLPADLNMRMEPDPARTGGVAVPASRGEQGTAEVTGRSNLSKEFPPPEPGARPIQPEFEPWAADEPRFGARGRRHALSGTPGTPPWGNLAVGGPQAEAAPSAPQGASTTLNRRGLSGLVHMSEALRVEIEIEGSGRWTYGLCEWASSRGLEVRLGGRGVGTRDFLQAGRRVRVLVAPRGLPSVSFNARVLSVEAPLPPGGAIRIYLAVFGSKPEDLRSWERLFKGMREVYL